jgi:hypothetical protein
MSFPWFGRLAGQKNWMRKEVIITTYEKPQITVVASAVEAVHCTGHKDGGITDCPSVVSDHSVNAYEADE